MQHETEDGVELNSKSRVETWTVQNGGQPPVTDEDTPAHLSGFESKIQQHRENKLTEFISSKQQESTEVQTNPSK